MARRAWTSCFVGIAASTLLFAPAAAADTEADAWFLGTWAVACDRTVSDENPLVVFIRVPGAETLLMVVTSRSGPALASSTTRVLTKGAAREGRIEVDFDHGEGGINRAVLNVTSDTFQVARTMRPDGRVTTRDGVVLATGKPTASYRRCSPRR